MNKNSPFSHLPGGTKPPIQFTKLTQDDITLHKDRYVCLLLTATGRIGEKGKELHEAMQLFYEAFK